MLPAVRIPQLMKQTPLCHRQSHRLAEFVLVQAHEAMKSRLIAKTLQVLPKWTSKNVGRKPFCCLVSSQEVAGRLRMHFANTAIYFVHRYFRGLFLLLRTREFRSSAFCDVKKGATSLELERLWQQVRDFLSDCLSPKHLENIKLQQHLIINSNLKTSAKELNILFFGDLNWVFE